MLINFLDLVGDAPLTLSLFRSYYCGNTTTFLCGILLFGVEVLKVVTDYFVERWMWMWEFGFVDEHSTGRYSLGISNTRE